MRDERYTITVTDDSVEVCGTLTIREAFDFLNFFEKEGYNSVEDGFDRSAIFLRKRDFEKERKDFIIKEHLDLEKEYENKYNDLEKKHEIAIDRIIDLERLIKELMTEEKLKQDNIRKEYEKNLKYQQLLELRRNPNVKIILSDMGIMTEEQEADFENSIKITSPMDYYVNPDPTKE